MTSPTPTFADRLRDAIASRGRLCVGIDPHPGLLEAWGLPAGPHGLRAFADACVDAFGGVAAAVKPQVALFEEHGAAGMAALETTIAGLREAGALVIADAKRGDIGSTMSAYARAWLGEHAPLRSDAVTVNPYLGFGALAPAIEAGAETGAGVFVLARTSNPEGRSLQTACAEGEDGATSVGQMIVDAAHAAGPGTAGLVIGATRAHGLDLAAFDGPILAPGIGAQGAAPADLPEIFPGATDLLLPNSSRAILRAGPAAPDLRDAAARARDAVEAALP